MRIGVDVGGTKIEAIALDGERVLARRRVPAARGDYEGTLKVIAQLVDDLRRETGQTGSIGVGIPGVISSHTGLVKNANSVWLIGKPFDRDLARVLDAPVRVANDANCFALSEATDGAARSARVVFGAIIGTGTGGGIVVEGRIVDGRNRIAGEWGHNPLPWAAGDETPGPPCYCGRSGCIETFLSGCGLSRAYEALTSRTIEAEEISAQAASGDAAAIAALEIYEGRMGRALASVINVLDPDVIVLGGGLSNIERLYAQVPARWAPYVFSDRADTPLVKAVHGDSSGVRGAAWLW
jgi:fructokinase